jgi:hypothetical protein
MPHPNQLAFLRNLLALTPEQLALQHEAIGEAMGEEEDGSKVPLYKLQLNVVTAIGAFLYGPKFEDAMKARAEPEFDPENIYNLPGIRQSIEEDRRR